MTTPQHGDREDPMEGTSRRWTHDDTAQLSEATMQAIADRVLDQLKSRQPTRQDSGSSAEGEFSTALRLSSLPP